MKLLGIYLILFSFLSMNVVFAQESEPTPVSPVSMQGTSNLGLIQPFVMPDVMTRIGISAWRDASFTGDGIRIGVMDQGFGGYQDFVAETGASVQTVRNESTDVYQQNEIVHGTQVLRVIHSIAPDAELYICEYLSLDKYIQCIDRLIASDVDIINHSAGVPALPLDGTSPWSQQVDRAAREGILWVNAAGNFASGVLRDFFTDSNINSYHEFRGAETVEALETRAVDNQRGRILLSWVGTETRPAASIDLDLEVVNSAGQLIESSSRQQTGLPGQDALEFVFIDMSEDFFIRVRTPDANPVTVEFALFVEFAAFETGQFQQSIIAPADSINSFTVGALQGNFVAPYSSRGPTATGTIKPNAVVQGEVELDNNEIFVGTSSAAPIVAGMAALLLDANPDWSREQLFNFLEAETQDDTENPGADINYGNGRLFLPAPERVQPVAEPVVLPEISTVSDLAGLGARTISQNRDWIPYEQTFDGVTMVLVPTGCFEMGRAFDDRPNEYPPHRVCNEQPFWLDKTEVSNVQYGDVGWWQLPQHPREVVNWFNARAFCDTRSVRLPTEMEWEFSARGPDSLLYPWGNEFDESALTYGGNSGSQTSFVGERPAGASWVGAVDLVGNVWEWTSSANVPYPYNASASEVSVAEQRVMRGGSWINGSAVMSAAFRVADTPDLQLNTVGFRCARDFETDDLDVDAFLSREPLEIEEDAEPVFHVNSGVNLRSGPGTAYEVSGSARPGQSLRVTARAEVGEYVWYRIIDLDNIPKWVRSDFGDLDNINEWDLPLQSQ